MMHEALRVLLSGEMTSEKLENLRGLLGLTRRGRLTDEEDADFGYRYLREDWTNRTEINLHRHTQTEWQIRVTYQSEPPGAEVLERLRSDILLAADRLGLSVQGVR